MRILNAYGEDFLIAHFQGGCAVSFNPLLIDFSKRDITLPGNISVVTMCNVPRKSMLIKQLDRNGIAYLNDADTDDEWWSNTDKIKYITSALPKVKTEFVLVLDASDVLFANSPGHIFDLFCVYDKKLVFGATKVNHPKQNIDRIRDRDWRGDFRYFNAGTAFGYTADARRFYGLVRDIHESGRIRNPDESEQLIVRHAFAECTDWVDFDWKCSMFQTFGNTDLEDVEADVYRVR